MQGKGLVRFFLIFLTIVCIYQFGLMLPTRGIENRAASYAQSQCADAGTDAEKTACVKLGTAAYLDSLSNQTVLNLGFAKFTYQDLKKQQLALGLDLKGGMSVVMQIDLRDLVRVLAGEAGKTNENFQKAIELATEKQKSAQSDYITLFKQAWEEVSDGEKLAPIFQNNPALREDITFDTNNDEVAAIIRQQADETVQLTFNRLKQRIDKFGVTQPNVTLDNTTDRIIVELPGIDNPERARNFLQTTAKLEFFDVYRVGEIRQQLDAANRKIAAREKALESNDTTATTPGDSTAIDSINPLNSLQQGLYSKLSVNGVTPDGQWAFQQAVIGVASATDTAKVNEYLASPEVVMPRDLRFVWSADPLSDESDIFRLYAAKIPPNGVAPVEGDKITDAKADLDPQNNVYVVSLSMNNDGARAWAKMTQAAVPDNREIAIVLDDEVVSSPAVQSVISDGNTQITGQFTPQEAQDLANILKVGKLPAKTQIIEEAIVGPSLGKDNIRSSIRALLIGMSLVLVFMILYYGSGGIVSIIALLLNLFFIFGSLASLGSVLTLPGIAGIILTIGMAVDANVIIYERIREELRDGKSMKLAIADGFKHSYSAIIDANVTTILTAIVLFYFGLGPIKGFATVLIIGVICSLFTAVLVGRLIIDWWTGKDRNIAFSSKISESAFANLNIDFVSMRRFTYVISGVIIAAGLISFFTRGFELGVDFKGGYSYAVEFEEQKSIEDVRSTMTAVFGEEPTVKAFGDANTVEITTSYLIDSQDEDADAQVLAKLYEGVVQLAGEANMEGIDKFAGTDESGIVSATHITRSIKVGPTIADDIKQSAFYAAIFALLLIFLYILLRFRNWQYSLGAVTALFHDVLVVMAMFSIFHGILGFSLEIDQNFIAAILTVIGYSINDTVVVFDRIREFMNAYTKKTKKEVINLAVNNTVSRTIITSLTTLFVVLMLFLFGGGSIKGFAFALVIGIIVGTYSSVFVATPVVYDLLKEDAVKAVGKRTKYGNRVKA